MSHSSEYIGAFVTFLMAAGIAALMLFLNAALGPKKKTNVVKAEPFECGVGPVQVAAGHFSVKFYLVAMLFILFDVEIVWFFPWAVVLKNLKWLGITEMFSFVFVLLLGFIYAWKKGVLEWEK